MNDARILLMDACVVLDYLKADRELFKLISENIGELYVPEEVVSEIKDVGGSEELKALGLKIIETNADDYCEAALRSQSGPLSPVEHICFLTAQRNGFVCVTNDTRLRKKCERERVETMRGLQLILLLFERGGIDKQRALQIGARARQNPWLAESAYKNFAERVEKIAVESERRQTPRD